MLKLIILAAAITAGQPPQPKGPPKILSAEQRASLSRITNRGFVTGQKDLQDGRKELTWTDGKNTVVTTQKVERVQGKKSADPRRAEITAVKAERDTMKVQRDKAQTECDSIKADRDTIKAERDALKAEKDKKPKAK
jgi:hypothetical protein